MINVNLVTDKFVLPNGLLVVLHREPTASSAFVEVRYHVGSKDDPAGRSGFAHLFEHLMFQGSRHTGDKDHMQWLEDYGGESNASTNEDHTDYHESVPTSALPLALWLESDRMAYPLDRTDVDKFTKEREVVKNEYRQHYDDVPYGHVANIARAAVFGDDHPYGRPTIGDPHQLDGVTLEELRTFAKTYYRPNNATLVVCGAFDTAAMKELVTKYFATIPPGPPPPARAFPPPALARDKRIEVQAGVQAPMVMLAWPAPPVHGEGYAELRYALRFFSGRVHYRLVTEKKIADDVDVDVDTGKLGSLVLVTVRLKPGESPSTAISVVEEYLNEATRVGRLYPWNTFGDYRTRAVVNEVTSLERLSGRAAQILHGIEYHEERETVQLDLKKLLAVRAEDVGAALDDLIVDRPRVTIVVTPTPSAPRAGKVASR